ncbi:hypothetical protein J4441_03205 [Candidatus Micrarchaeota archaeon]|nr:hypothetical protein [Candidatus Micrarchaeota archaeon]
MQDFEELDKSAKLLFAKHIKKFEALVPRRFLGGSNYTVENVGQGRIICKVEGETVYIVRMFQTHKEYEKWFRSGMP